MPVAELESVRPFSATRIMKSKHTLLIVFLLLLSGAGCLFARRILWEPKTKPPISLIEAHEIALAALKDRHTDFYCTHASLAQTFTEGDWEFRFSSASGASTSVSVGSDKKARVSDDGFTY